MDQGNKTIKTPVFIGCINPEIIKGIDSHITMTESYNVELVVISPAIQERLQYQYLLTLLDAENQSKILEQRNDNVKQAEARKSAFQLRDVIESVYGINYSFDRSDIKFAIERTRGRLSTNQVANLVEFLSIHDFIQPVDLNEKPHKRKWRFNFSPQDSLNNTVVLQNELSQKISLLQTQLELLEENKGIFQRQIDEEDVEDDTNGAFKDEGEMPEPPSDLDQMRSALTHGMCDTAKEMKGEECVADGTEHTLVVEEPVKKKRGRPKKDLPSDPLEHDSDCRCSAHKKGKTDTEKYLEKENKKKR